MSDPDVILGEEDRLAAWANRLRDMAKRSGGKLTVRKEGVDFFVDPYDNPQTIVESFNIQKALLMKPKKSKGSKS